MHGISLDEHRELVREHEWKEEEFEAGFQKGVIPRDGSKDFLTYEALVRRELAKGQVSFRGSCCFSCGGCRCYCVICRCCLHVISIIPSLGIQHTHSLANLTPYPCIWGRTAPRPGIRCPSFPILAVVVL